MNRRDSLQKLILGGTVLFLAPSVLQSCKKDPATDPNPDNNNNNNNPKQPLVVDLSLAANAALNSAGGSKVINDVIVINTGTNFIALSAICTHQGCTVGYNSSAVKLQCPCHGSEFAVTGSVLTGPAASPLTTYPVSKSGNTLTITL
jgi:cytochrome b6-f complex iron-sulfur subunit